MGWTLFRRSRSLRSEPADLEININSMSCFIPGCLYGSADIVYSRIHDRSELDVPEMNNLPNHVLVLTGTAPRGGQGVWVFSLM